VAYTRPGTARLRPVRRSGPGPVDRAYPCQEMRKLLQVSGVVLLVLLCCLSIVVGLLGAFIASWILPDPYSYYGVAFSLVLGLTFPVTLAVFWMDQRRASG